MSKGIFITGTDTGVGKTVVTAVIIRALMGKGIKAGVMKPFETGCDHKDGVLMPSDGMFLRDMAEMDDQIEMVTPVRFEQPLAPMVAADIEKKPIDIDKVFEAYRKLSAKYDFMVVEGIGGLLVPLFSRRLTDSSGAYFVSDFIRDLKLPVVIVSRPSLGTINHTLLSVDHALKSGLDVRGVIMNYSSRNDISESTNPGVLDELCPVSLIGHVPYLNPVTKKKIDLSASDIGGKILKLLPLP